MFSPYTRGVLWNEKKMWRAFGKENTLEVCKEKKNDENEKIKEGVEKGKEEYKNKMRSNPWQLGHLDNEINFEPLNILSFLSLRNLSLVSVHNKDLSNQSKLFSLTNFNQSTLMCKERNIDKKKIKGPGRWKPARAA